jgi:uncharacterized lipoprotein YddW (UPF0748 family)
MKRYKIIFLFTILLAIIISSCKKNNSVTPSPVIPPVVITPPTPVWDVNALRGAWVTNVASTALDSRANIKTCVQNCKAAGINNIFMVVYNNARTIYPSTIMENLVGVRIKENYAGRDPLQEMVEEGHAAGLKVHAWFEYGFASSYLNNGGPIIAAKPSWAAKDVNNNNVVKNDFHWLNAFDTAVQNYMINLFKEVVTNYDVDGVQGDDRLPACPTSSGYDAHTTSLYQAENGVPPPTNNLDAAWVQWRAKKLNTFLKRLRTAVKTIKPNVQLTMSPSPYPWGLDNYLQDWPTWVDSAWVDAVLPQCYRYNITDYGNTINQQKTYYRNAAVPFYPGVLSKSGTYIPDDTFLKAMISKNRAVGFKGECFFFYEGIKDKISFFQNQYPYIP